MGLSAELVERFAAATDVIRELEQLRTYECDGLTGRRVMPALVALPGTTAEVQAVVRICSDARIPFVARGAGTGLSGGALPVVEGIVISLERMNRILEIDVDNGLRGGQARRHHREVQRAEAEAIGFYYPPDPSAQPGLCTMGGNIAPRMRAAPVA